MVRHHVFCEVFRGVSDIVDAPALVTPEFIAALDAIELEAVRRVPALRILAGGLLDPAASALNEPGANLWFPVALRDSGRPASVLLLAGDLV
jgi:hypothetical protein